jgi:hypothetical protein
MSKVKIIKTLAASVAMLLLWTSTSSATPIYFAGEGKGAEVSIYSPGLGNLTTFAGELNWRWDYSDPQSFFFAYCVDINNWARHEQNVTAASTETLMAAIDIDAGNKAAWLINTYASTIHETGTGIEAAALQVAIWQVLFGSGSNPFVLQTGGAIAAKQQDYLFALNSAPGGYSQSSTTWFDAPAGQGQDQMIPTPEPGSLLLCATGIAGWVTASLRRRRRQAQQ